MIPWFRFTVFHFGPLPIQVWGCFVALGMLVAMMIIWRRSEQLGLSRDTMLDLAVWLMIGGIIGARLFHIAFYEPGYYLANPLEMLKVWHGGLSSFGGLAGAGVAFWYFVWRRKIALAQLLPMADIFAFAAVFGWMIGRGGCFMIHDHMGAHSNCFLAIRSPDGPRLEMALLEIVGLIPLGILFFVCRKKKLPQGWYVGILFVYYGVLRFVLDFFRATDIINPDARYLGLTPAQYFAILLVGCGSWFLLKAYGVRRPRQ